MSVFSVPLRLRFAALLAFLAVPVIVLQVVLVSKAPWWNLPLEQMRLWAFASGIVILPLSLALGHGKRWALILINALAGAWIAVSIFLAFRYESFWMALIVIAIVLFWILFWLWVRHEMNRSFFNPQVEWYQGLPKPIPGLKCQADVSVLAKGKGAAQKIAFNVCRLDQDGAFIFFDRNKVSGAKAKIVPQKKKVSLEFKFKDTKLSCFGAPVKKMRAGLGIGIRFVDLNPDLRKELGDFIERLKGEGYVG